MDDAPARSRTRLHLIAAGGFVLELVAIYLLLARELSFAVVAPLLIIGMFMTFAPALAAKKRSGG